MYQPRTHGLRFSPRNVMLAGALAAFSFLALSQGSQARAEAGAANAGAKAKTKPVASSCQAAYQSAQQKEEAGQLVEAHRLYLSCSDTACGESVWHACVEANTALRATLPSIVPVALDSHGNPRTDVEVKMDGQVIISQLNGLAIPVDPGPHEFSFSVGSDVFASAKISVVEGERNRILAASKPAPASAGHPRVAQTAAE